MRFCSMHSYRMHFFHMNSYLMCFWMHFCLMCSCLMRYDSFLTEGAAGRYRPADLEPSFSATRRMGKADRYRHLKYRRVSGAVVYRRLSLTRRAGGGDRRDPAAAGDAPRLVCRPAALALAGGVLRHRRHTRYGHAAAVAAHRPRPAGHRRGVSRGDQYGAGHLALPALGALPADRRADRLAADDRWGGAGPGGADR